MLRSLISALLLLLITITIVPTIVSASVPLETLDDIYIVDPRYSVPLVIKPGSLVNITIYTKGHVIKALSARIIAPNLSYGAEIKAQGNISKDYYYVTIAIPEGIKEELYDVILKVVVEGKGNITLRSPRSLWYTTKEFNELTIVHIGDSIIGGFYAGRTAAEMYLQTVVYSNMLDADIVVMVGDDVDVGNDVASLEIFNMLTNQIRKPTYIIPGNHDWAQVTTLKEFLYYYYGKYVGPRYWVRELGKFVLIGLDGGYENYLDDTQLKWLNKTLSMYPDRSVIIIIHPPIVMDPGNYTFKSADELISKYEKNVLGAWKAHKDSLDKFIKILNKYTNIIAIIAGDTHKDCVARLNDRIWLITVTAAGHPNVYKFRGFRVIKLYSDGRLEFPVVPKGKNPYGTEASINTDYSLIREFTDEKYTMFAYNVELSPKFELKLSNVPLYFYVNASVEPSEYKFYGNVSLIKSYDFAYYGDFLIFRAYVDIVPGLNYTIILASYEDKVPPKVSIKP
ncbi:MAG: hypothetical protein DRO18_01955, partial [Thermoprotei archaeon]